MSKKHISLPVTNHSDLKKLEQGLLHRGSFGRREYTIWELSVMTCLSITNIVKFKRTDIYNPNGIPRTYVYIRGVGNTYLRPARKLLNDYWK